MEQYNSEFDLYESIVNGKLRPFLPEYSSENHLKKLIEQLSVIKMNISLGPNENPLDKMDFENFGYKPGDEFEIKIAENKDATEIFISPIEKKELNELIDIDIPPPPDLKAEYFLYLIEDEYEKIIRKAKDVLVSGREKEKISFYANKNIQIAKNIAIEAHHLSKQLKPIDSDALDNSNYYILFILKLFLKRSIIAFQSLFEPYLECRFLTEEEIRTIFYEGTPIELLLKGLINIAADVQQEETSSSKDENKAESRSIDSSYFFSLEGEFWKIKYKEKENLLRDLKRMRYIVHLLDNPNVEFLCHELSSLVNGNKPDADPYYSKMSDEDLKENEGLSLCDLPIEQLDKEDKEKIGDMIHDLWDKYMDDNQTSDQKIEARENWEKAKKYLENEYGFIIIPSAEGPKFKFRARLKKDYEKTRVNVTNHIRNSIKGIEVKIPELAKHLRKYIMTGAICCYRPDPDLSISWTIRWK